MPTLFARSTKVQLSVCDLAASTTKVPSSYPNPSTTAKLQAVASEIAAGDVLPERPVYCKDSGSHMRFLGEFEDMPFFMVQAGMDLFMTEATGQGSRRSALGPLLSLSKRAESHETDGSDSTLITLATITTANDGDSVVADSIEQGETQAERMIGITQRAKHSSSGRRIRRPTSPTALSMGRASSVSTLAEFNTPSMQKPIFVPSIARYSARTIGPMPLALTQPALVPRALALTVFLTKESFAHSSGTKTKHVPQDIKIDVFLNGGMTASTYVPARYRGEANNFFQLTQRFSGRRVDRMAERPWVIVPPGQNVDGTLRASKRNRAAYVGAQQRWERIGKALKEEGEKFGRNQYGDVSVIGEYLASLAKFEMPEEVEHMQKGGGQKFGVIDVIITLGKGQKDMPEKGYLKEPTKLRLRGFNYHEEKKEEQDNTLGESEMEPMAGERVTIDKADPAEFPSAQFTMPIAPSAAPSATRRRQSVTRGVSGRFSRPRSKPKRIGSLPSPLTEKSSAMQVRSPPMSSSSSPVFDLSLVSTDAPVPRFTGRPEIDLPSPLPDEPISSVPSCTASRPQITRTSRSREVETANDTKLCQSGAGRNVQRQGSASSPVLDQDDVSPESPVNKSRTRNLREITKALTTRRALGRHLRSSGAHTSSDSMSTYENVFAAVEKSRRKFELSPQGKRLRTSRSSVSVVSKSSLHGSEKRSIHSLSPPAEDPNPKRQRYPHGWAVSDKPTLAEEMAHIEALSKEPSSSTKPNSEARATRLRQSSIGLPTPASTQEDQTKTDVTNAPPRKIVKLKIKGPVAPLKTFSPNTINAALPPNDLPTHPTPHNPKPTFTKIISKPRPRRPRNSTASAHLLQPSHPPWSTPELSQDSILGYAEEGPWDTRPPNPGAIAGNGDRSVYRQVKAERNGWFEESTVLMGVRFLVG